MTRWVALSQVPEGVKQTMQTTFARWEKLDLGVEVVIDGMYNAKEVTQQACKAINSATNKTRIPELCEIVSTAHTDISRRDSFQAVALFCGLSYSHIQRLFYKRPVC